MKRYVLDKSISWIPRTSRGTSATGSKCQQPLLFTPFTNLLKTIVNTGQEIIANPECQHLKSANTNVSELMMDSEFREYTRTDFATKYYPQGRAERLKNPEYAFINVIYFMLITSEQYKEALKKSYLFLTEHQKKKFEIFNKWSDESGTLQEFIGELIQHIVTNEKQCKHAGISLSRLVDLLHPLNPKLLTDYVPPNSYEGGTLRINTYKDCIQLFQKQLFYKLPNETSFLSHYFLFCEHLTNGVFANDVTLCKQLIASDDYKRFITNIDRVGHN